MSDLIEIFCLTNQDVALLWSCPIISGLASLIRGWTCELNLMKPPSYEEFTDKKEGVKKKQTSQSKRERGYWIVGIFLSGISIGFGVSLLFLGAIQPTASGVGRIWFLSLILGYSTPVVLRNIDKKVENALTKSNKS